MKYSVARILFIVVVVVVTGIFSSVDDLTYIFLFHDYIHTSIHATSSLVSFLA